MMTVGLLAVVVYLYTVVAFNFFRKFYNMSEDEDEPDMKCDDMMTVSISYGYLSWLLISHAADQGRQEDKTTSVRNGCGSLWLTDNVCGDGQIFVLILS